MGITLLLRTSLGSSEKKWETCAGRACSWSYHIPSSGISHSCECHRLDAYFNMNATPEWLTMTYLRHKPWHNQYGTPQEMQWGRILHRLIWYIYIADCQHGQFYSQRPTSLTDFTSSTSRHRYPSVSRNHFWTYQGSLHLSPSLLDYLWSGPSHLQPSPPSLIR